MKIQCSLGLAFSHLIVSYILKIYGFSMDMIPIDSPKIQLLPQNFTEHERHQFLTSMSLSRAYQHRSSNITLKPGSFILEPSITRSYYISGLPIGWIQGKPYTAYVVLDTGSSTTWIQCEGCKPCFTFQSVKFDYRISETYQRMGLEDRSCSPREDYHGSCGFSVKYGLGNQGTEAKGMMGRDTFFFRNPKEPKMVDYPRIAFGCGFESKGFVEGRGFVGPDNTISGILGLSPKKVRRAFIAQLDGHIKGRFSYCLLPNYRKGYNMMNFGDDAQISGDETRKLQSISMFIRKHYYLAMIGISIEGNRLPIDPSIFYPSPSRATRRRSGVIIDTGAPHTVLTKSAFDPLRDAIVKYFSEKFGLQPMPRHPRVSYRLCYESYPPHDDDYPSIIFHFNGQGQEGDVDMVFTKYNMFDKIRIDDHKEIMCLIMVDTPTTTSLLGAYQQTDFAILYDIPNSLLHFVPQICVPTGE